MLVFERDNQTSFLWDDRWSLFKESENGERLIYSRSYGLAACPSQLANSFGVCDSVGCGKPLYEKDIITEKTDKDFQAHSACESYECPDVKFNKNVLNYVSSLNYWTDGDTTIFRGCSDFFQKDKQTNEKKKLFKVRSRCLPDISTFNNKICPSEVSFGSETLQISSTGYETARYQNDRIVIMEDKENPGFVSVYKDNCIIATGEARSLNWCVGDINFVYSTSESCRKDNNEKFATGLPLHDINSPERECLRSCYFWLSPDLPIIMGRKEVNGQFIWSTINDEENIESRIYLKDNRWTFEITKDEFGITDLYFDGDRKLMAKFEGQCPEMVTFFDDNGLAHASPCVDSRNWLGGRYFQSKSRPMNYFKSCPFINIDDLWLSLSKDETATWLTEDGHALKKHEQTLLWTLFNKDGKIIGKTKDLPAEYPHTVNSWYQVEEYFDKYIDTPVMFDKFPKCFETVPDESDISANEWLIVAVGCLSIIIMLLLIFVGNSTTRKIRWKLGINSKYFRNILPSNLNEKFSDALVDKFIKIGMSNQKNKFNMI